MPHNTYLLSYKRNPHALAWDIGAESGDSFPGALYTARTLQVLDGRLGPAGLAFIATDDVHSVPLTGDFVVVILREDEWRRIPRYAGTVRGVFKTYGTDLRWAANPFVDQSVQAALSSIQDMRTEIARLPTRWRAARASQIFELPLGYYRQLDRTPTPILERRFDLYFGYSIRSTRAVKNKWFAMLGTPKNRSRRLLLQPLSRLKANHPEFDFEFYLTQKLPKRRVKRGRALLRGYARNEALRRSARTESRDVQLFEALRYGCAVVAEALPSRWFYDGAPIERVRSWDEFEAIVPRLLADPVALQRRHRESLAWWRDFCSEEAVAQFIERSLRNAQDSRRALGLTGI